MKVETSLLKKPQSAKIKFFLFPSGFTYYISVVTFPIINILKIHNISLSIFQLSLNLNHYITDAT